MHRDFRVFLIDDDPQILQALCRLLQIEGYRTEAFSSPRRFLDEHDPTIPGCAVFDFAMPECDGLALQQELAKRAPVRPIIFLTGHGTIPVSVRAIQAGAIDFLLKPVERDALLDAIKRAVHKDEAARYERAEQDDIVMRLETLTPREREVLIHVVAGRMNKQIAADLGTVEKTIKVHRSRMMLKMGVHTVADLVRLTQKIGLQPLSS